MDNQTKLETRGGFRPGAGRKATGRKKRSFFVTDQEDVELRDYLTKYRITCGEDQQEASHEKTNC